ncbi:MAG: flagellar export chaperone FliS [Planctomycetota bacterium]
MPNPPAVNPYLKTQIMTASPQELRMMLYDGCLRFIHQGKEGLAKQDFERSYESLSRAQKIVLELSTSLKHDLAPELCEKLSALYTYIYKLLVEASTSRVAEPLEEAIKLLEFERETWAMLMQQNGDDDGPDGKPKQPGPQPSNPYAQQTAMSAYARSA